MDAHAAGIAVSRVRWHPCHRIVSSRFPTIHLFERVAAAADWDALYALESMTNPRLSKELGALEKIAREDRSFGPGAAVIMAPFVYLNPAGGRFTDAGFGAFYAANTLATAIAETRHHREIFLRATHQEALEVTMRCYVADISARLHDIRGLRTQMPDVYHAESYARSQILGRELKFTGSNGIVYDSVRHAQGQCIAIYRPRLVQNLRQSVHLRYLWDGARISHVYELKPIE
jgi:RES domain-containing protein